MIGPLRKNCASIFTLVYTTPRTDSSTHTFNTGNFVPFFTKNDISNLLRDLNANSSPGPDGIHPVLLKNCAVALSTPIYLIFCISLRTGSFPSTWKEANVTPIHKGGIATSVENYRPICILSAIAKVFEKVIAVYLKDHLSSTNFIHPAQHGFVKGKSCLTNLLTAIDYWTLALDNHHPCDVIYLDFKKAFDMVDHSILLKKMNALNIPEYLQCWFRSYLMNRRFRVSLRGSYSNWSTAPSGVPQRSVLGPILFNIFINDLPPCLQYSFCVLFADDLKLYLKIQSDVDRIHLQSDLNNISLWATKNCISFNISKSAVLHLGSNNDKLAYFLNGVKLSPKDSIRDLGIIVDSKLKFHDQCASAAKKAISTANYVMKSFSFLTPHLFSILYKVNVRPHLEYCVQAWRPYLNKSIDILEKAQRKITKWCPGLYYIPYQTRLTMLNLPTLTNRFDRGDCIEAYKLLKNHDKYFAKLIFTLSTNSITRGHSLKLALPKFKTNARKFFFSYRVALLWNKLPDFVVSSSSVNQWKSRFDTAFPVI